MANDLSSAMSMLKGILGDDAEEKIATVMQGLSSGEKSSEQNIMQNDTQQMQNSGTGEGFGGIDENTLGYIMKMKGIIDEMSHSEDDRSRLLLSLRPYMREGRQKSIDNALKVMALTRLSGVFGKL